MPSIVESKKAIQSPEDASIAELRLPPGPHLYLLLTTINGYRAPVREDIADEISSTE